MNIIDILARLRAVLRGPGGRFPAAGHDRPAVPISQGTGGFPRKRALPRRLVVGQGLVRVFKTGPGGKEHVLHMVGPGGSFAEVAAIGGFPLPASAEAVKKTTCVLLPLERFRQALAEDHELCLGMMTGLTVWVRRLVTLMEDITLRDAAGRLARFLLELPQSKPHRRRHRQAAGPEALRGQPLEPHQRNVFAHAPPPGRRRPDRRGRQCPRRGCSSPKSSARWPKGCFPSCSGFNATWN